MPAKRKPNWNWNISRLGCPRWAEATRRWATLSTNAYDQLNSHLFAINHTHESSSLVRHRPSHFHLPIQAGRPVRGRSLPSGAQQTLSGHRHDPEAAAPIGQAHRSHCLPDGKGREVLRCETGEYVSRHLDATSVLLCAESAAKPSSNDAIIVVGNFMR